MPDSRPEDMGEKWTAQMSPNHGVLLRAIICVYQRQVLRWVISRKTPNGFHFLC